MLFRGCFGAAPMGVTLARRRRYSNLNLGVLLVGCGNPAFDLNSTFEKRNSRIRERPSPNRLWAEFFLSDL